MKYQWLASQSHWDGVRYDPGSTVTFTGTGLDEEEGDLSAQGTWTSSLDGSLGTGSSLSTILSDGQHTITYSVTDFDGDIGSDTITVKVNAPPGGSRDG